MVVPFRSLLATAVAALVVLPVPARVQAADTRPAPAAAASPRAAANPRAAASPAAGASRDAIATVNGAPVTRQEFDAAVERLPDQYRPLARSAQGRRQILDNLILSRLLFARAKAQGFDKDAKVRSQIDAYAEQAAIMAMMQQVADRSAGPVAESDAKAYYDANPGQFVKSQEQVRASHVLVETETEAAKVREEVLAGKDFAEVAKSVSKDTGSAARGGDLGLFSRSQMVPEFAEAAFALKNRGDISPVVKTQFGYHVIKLAERRPAEQAGFAEVKGQIEARLREEKQQAAVERYVKEVRDGARVEVNEASLAD